MSLSLVFRKWTAALTANALILSGLPMLGCSDKKTTTVVKSEVESREIASTRSKSQRGEDLVDGVLNRLYTESGLEIKPQKFREVYAGHLRPLLIETGDHQLVKSWDQFDRFFGSFSVPQTRVVKIKDGERINYTLQFFSIPESPIIRFVVRDPGKVSESLEIRLDGKLVTDDMIKADMGLSAFRDVEAMKNSVKAYVESEAVRIVTEAPKPVRLLTPRQVLALSDSKLAAYQLALAQLVGSMEEVERARRGAKPAESGQKTKKTAQLLLDFVMAVKTAHAQACPENQKCLDSGFIGCQTTANVCSSADKEVLKSQSCGGGTSACRPEIFGKPANAGAYCTSRQNRPGDTFTAQCLELMTADKTQNEQAWKDRFQQAHGKPTFSEAVESYGVKAQEIRTFCTAIQSQSIPPSGSGPGGALSQSVLADQKDTCGQFLSQLSAITDLVVEAGGGAAQVPCVGADRRVVNGVCVPYQASGTPGGAFVEPAKPNMMDSALSWIQRNSSFLIAVTVGIAAAAALWYFWPEKKKNPPIPVSEGPTGVGATRLAFFPYAINDPWATWPNTTSNIAPGGGPASGSLPSGGYGTR